MITFKRKAPFYFLRHGQTDHNVHNIYDDESEVELNQKGILQATELQRVISNLDIDTVCSSPLRRVQQTKELVLKGKIFKDIVIEDLRECPSAYGAFF